MKIQTYLLITLTLFSQKTLAVTGATGGAGGGAGGGTSNITITPPPTPQEILPPKPIIIAPILVKQKHRSSKLAVIHSGPPQSPYGIDTPGYFQGVPSMDGSRKLNRFQQNNFARNLFARQMMQNYNSNNPRAVMQGDYLNITPNYNNRNFPQYPQNSRNLNLSQYSQNPQNTRNLMQNIIMQNSHQDMPDLTNNIKMEGERNDLSMIPETSDKLKNDEVSREGVRYINTIHIMNDLENGSIANLDGKITELGAGLDKGMQDIDSKIQEFQTLVGEVQNINLNLI